MSLHKSRASPTKQKALDELKQLLRQYNTIGVVTIERITSGTMHSMRRKLRGTAVIKMAKNALMVRALEEMDKEKPGLAKLVPYITGPTAFLLTSDNAFKIATKLAKDKLPAPAKAGAIATNDVVVPAINTGVGPGPFISELQAIGLKTRIERGTIKIVDEAVVCKTGEKVSKTLAAVLSRLGIEPFQVGLTVKAAIEDGALLQGDALIIDEEQYLLNLQTAAQRAYALAVNAPITTKKAIPAILSKAMGKATALSVHSAYPTKRSLPFLLGKAVASAKALAAKAA